MQISKLHMEISGSTGEGIHFNKLYRTSLCKHLFVLPLWVGIDISGGGNEAGERFATGLLGLHRNTAKQIHFSLAFKALDAFTCLTLSPTTLR